MEEGERGDRVQIRPPRKSFVTLLLEYPAIPEQEEVVSLICYIPYILSLL